MEKLGKPATPARPKPTRHRKRAQQTPENTIGGSRLKGVENVKVHFASSRIEIDHDAERVSVDDLVTAVAKAGYKATPSAF